MVARLRTGEGSAFVTKGLNRGPGQCGTFDYVSNWTVRVGFGHGGRVVHLVSLPPMDSSGIERYVPGAHPRSRRPGRGDRRRDLSVAAFDEGRQAQAFPSFGSERTGAPVVSFCRIDDREIRTREPVMAPDALIVQDVTLINQVDLFSGLSPSDSS